MNHAEVMQEGPRRAAWAVAGLAVAGLVIAPFFGRDGIDIGQLAVIVGVTGLPLAGALIVSRFPRHIVGWLLCIIGVMWALTLFSSNYADRALAGGGDDRTITNLAVAVSIASGALTYGATGTFLFLLFPSGTFASRRWRVVGWIAGLNLAVGVVATPFEAGPLDEFAQLQNPNAAPGFLGDAFVLLTDAYWTVLLCLFVVSVASLVARFRRSGRIERQQLKWMMYAGFLVVASLFAWGFLSRDVASVLWGFSILMVGAAIAISILRFRLYDIDVIVNRTLVYGSLTAILGLAYFGGVALIQGLLPLQDEEGIAVAASTLVIAGLFRPLRARLQDFINLRFYRSKYDAERTIEAFTARLRDEVDLDEAIEHVLDVVQQTIQPADVYLWLKSPRSPIAARSGEPGT